MDFKAISNQYEFNNLKKEDRNIIQLLPIKNNNLLYYTKDILEQAYYYLNGKINKIKSLGLKFNYTDTISQNKCILGNNTICITTIYIINVLKLLDLLRVSNITVTERSYKGLLIYLIAHELSHIDQYIYYPEITKLNHKMMKLDDKKDYRKKSRLDIEINAITFNNEMINDSNSILYLIENKDKLEPYFGKFDIDLILYLRFKTDIRLKDVDTTNTDFLYKDKDRYVSYKSIKEKISVLIKDMYFASYDITEDIDKNLPSDLDELFKSPSIENITFVYIDNNNNVFNRDIYHNSKIDDSYDTLRFLSEMNKSTFSLLGALDYIKDTKTVIISRKLSNIGDYCDENIQTIIGEGH